MKTTEQNPFFLFVLIIMSASCEDRIEYFDEYVFHDEGVGQPCVSVVEYGADSSGNADCSQIVQELIEGFQRRGSNGTVYFPAGQYRFDHPCTLADKDFRNVPIKIKITGDGMDRSSLNCCNEKGIFLWETRTMTSQVTVEKLSFISHIPAAECAFSYTLPERGNRHNRSFICDSVSVNGLDSSCGFLSGLDVPGQWRPLIRNSVFEGKPGQRGSTGVSVRGTYTPRVENCRFRLYATAIDYETLKGEGGDFVNNELIGCDVGIYCSSPGIEPHLNINSNKFDCLKYGIHINSRKMNFIYDNVFSCTLAEGRYCDIFLECRNGGKQLAKNTLISTNDFRRSDGPERIHMKFGERMSDVYVRNNDFNGASPVFEGREHVHNFVLEDNR